MGMQIQSAGSNTNGSMQGEMRTPNRASFSGMVRGELMKITWLRATWMMLALLISGTALLTLLNISFKNVHELLTQDPVQYVYSYEFSQNLLVFRALSGFLAIIVTAFTLGLEYQQGTIRVILGRGVGRVRFLFSKMVALFLMAILVQLGGIILNGVLLVTVVGATTGSLTAVGVILSRFTGSFLLFFLYMIFNMWVSILLATAMTVLGGSLSFGLSFSLLWFPIDNMGVSLGTALLYQIFHNDMVLKVGNLFLGPALNVLPALMISSHIRSESGPFVTIGAGPTIAVILVYALVFLTVSAVLLRNRDVK